MARPKVYDPAVLGAQMRDVFWQKGYEGTSLSDLVAATGVRSGSLHAGFGQKSALFAAALDAYDEAFLGAMDVEGRGRDRLRHYIDLLHNRVTTDPAKRGCFVIASASEIDRHTDENREAIQSRIRRMQMYIENAMEEDGVRDPDASAAFLGAVVSLLTLARCNVDTATLRGIRDEAKRRLG